jgi:dienelactone hydrolase
MPIAAKPCDDDLGFVGGEVIPDVQPLPASRDLSAVDPAEPGSFQVFEKDVTIPITAEARSAAGYEINIEAGELSGTLYAPSNDGSSAAEGSFPLVIVLPGFQTSYSMYAGYAQHFASHGFVVVGVDTRSDAGAASHDREALEVSQTITWALETSELAGKIDPTKIATTGHSKGGKVSFFAAALDPRIDLAFGWDPSNAGGPPCFISAESCDALPVAPNCGAEEKMVPLAEGVMQYMHAETFVFGVPPDALVNPEEKHNAVHFYRGAPSPASLVMFDDGHVAWLSPPAGNADVVRITKTVQTAKLLAAFYGGSDLLEYLPGGTYLKDEAKVKDVQWK